DDPEDEKPTENIPEDELDDPDADLGATKTAGAPADGKSYKLGEEITYTIEVSNDGNVTLTDVEVTDDKSGAKIEEGTGYTVEDGKAKIAELKVGGEPVYVTVKYTVTEADILAGSITNTATVKGKAPEGVDDPEDEKPTENIPEDELDDSAPALSVTKEVSGDIPVNGYALGDTVTYKITVKNTGNVTVNDITVTDELTGNTGAEAVKIDKLVPNADVTRYVTYTVKQSDIDKGTPIINTAVATGTDPKGNPVTPAEGSAKADPVPMEPSYKIVKTADKTDVKPGDVITYTIAVTNTGNVTLKNLRVTDTLDLKDSKGNNKEVTLADGSSWTAPSLAPGATHPVIVTYTVQEEDIVLTSFENKASVTMDPVDDPKDEDPAKDPEKDDDESVTEAEVGTIYNAELVVTKSISDVGELKEGEMVFYTIIVENTGDVTVKDIKVTDPMLTGNEVLATITLAPGAKSDPISRAYVVTAADAATRSVTNIAYASGTDPRGSNVTASGSVTSNVKIIERTTPDDDADDPVNPVNPPAATYNYVVNYYNELTGELLGSANGKAKAGATVNAQNRVFDGLSYHRADPGTSMVISTDEAANVINVYYMPDVTVTIHFVDGETGETLRADYTRDFHYGAADQQFASPGINGYKPEFDNVWARDLTKDVEVTIRYFKTDGSTDGDNWGVLVDNGDELGYTIEEIVDEEVPLALREMTHMDIFFPFFCTMLALFVEMYYMKKRRDYQKDIYELRANILGRTFEGDSGEEE
ncbi:MAG: hypothetical protein Q4F31_05175, partial [Eubacteriales bacterium]|nr:hypothetical protein [Eubacteriales bacterium]